MKKINIGAGLSWYHVLGNLIMDLAVMRKNGKIGVNADTKS